VLDYIYIKVLLDFPFPGFSMIQGVGSGDGGRSLDCFPIETSDSINCDVKTSFEDVVTSTLEAVGG